MGSPPRRSGQRALRCPAATAARELSSSVAVLAWPRHAATAVLAFFALGLPVFGSNGDMTLDMVYPSCAALSPTAQTRPGPDGRRSRGLRRPPLTAAPTMPAPSNTPDPERRASTSAARSRWSPARPAVLGALRARPGATRAPTSRWGCATRAPTAERPRRSRARPPGAAAADGHHRAGRRSRRGRAGRRALRQDRHPGEQRRPGPENPPRRSPRPTSISTLAVNLKGTFFVSQAVGRVMIQRATAASSTWARRPAPWRCRASRSTA